MRTTLQGEDTAPLTQHLNFNADEDLAAIPAFLRHQKYEPKDESVIEEENSEPEAPIAHEDPEQVEAPYYGDPHHTIVVEEPVAREEIAEVIAAGYIQPDGLDGLSVEELRKQEEDIQRRILEKQKAEKQAVIDQIVEVVTNYKISVEDLVEALGGLKIKRKGVKAKLKYQDPVTGATWSGRGKEPSWIKDKDRKSFLIN